MATRETRQQNATQETTRRDGGAGTQGSERAQVREAGPERNERERGVETVRDGRGRGQAQQTGMSRRSQGGLAPSFGGYGAGDPLLTMQRMAEDMDRIFESFGFPRLGLAPVSRGLTRSAWRTPSTDGAGQQQLPQVWMPQVDVFQRENSLVVRADLPGMRRDDIAVDVEEGVLTIQGERRDEREEEREGYLHSERRYGRFFRAIPLPENVNTEEANASFKDGVLEVAFPMEERKRGRRIDVR